MKPVVLSVLAMTLVVTHSTAALTLAKTYPYRLSKEDQAELSSKVCTTRYGTKESRIDAWTYKPGDKRNVQASVECTSHRTHSQYELSHVASCERVTTWQCTRGEVRLRGMLDKHKFDIGTGWYNPAVAYDLVSRIAAYRSRKGDAVIDTEDVQCNLAKGPSKELIDIACKDKLVRISYWCPQSSCPRIFSITGYFVPADAGGL